MVSFWNGSGRGQRSREVSLDAGRRTRSWSVLGAAAFSAAVACAPSPPAAAPDAPRAEPEAASTESWSATTPASAGAQPPPSAPADATPAPSSAVERAAPPDPSGDDGLDADIAELSASTQSGAAPTPPSPGKPAAAGGPTSGREIVYRVTPKGLVIEVDGIHLRPEAKPFKEKSGAYGIRIVLDAESFDGRQYWVNKPKEGPLSIAGKVEGQGKSTRFADQREGSGEEPVLEGNPHRFEQRWPGRGQPKLWAGQTVTLEVGLWGVRAESERERPVRRLFVVKMVAGPRSQAVITPPTMDWGS